MPITESKGLQSGTHSSQSETCGLNWGALRLEDEIVGELADGVFTDVPRFLETVFPVDDDLLSTVMESASERNGLYNNAKTRWAGYPVKPARHAIYQYKPFAELVRSISDCIPAEKRNEVEWHDRHDHTPLSLDPSAPKIRPDIVATLGGGISELDNRFPWSRMLVPIEVKKRHKHSGDEGGRPALLQLLKYMRMIFHEAVDRSFVLGIVLAHTKMSVYLADRTGVLGSSVFDIHKVCRFAFPTESIR